MPAAVTGLPTVSVVIAAYTDQRWNWLQQAVASVRNQTVPVLETIVVIDHHPGLLEQARHGLSGVTIIPNTRSRGASGARNTGVAASHGEIVGFLDDDAVAAPSWLGALLRHFASPEVIGVGGSLAPIWAGIRPRWFPREFDWAVGASYLGMPETAEPVRNVWSGSMLIRRQVFDAIEGFREGFGKVGGQACPEDTDLCLRASAGRPGGTWIYEPAGVAGHRVPAQRATVHFFLARCVNEGRGKAALAALDGTGTSTAAERSYSRRVLPHGIVRGLREALTGDPAGAARSLAIVSGLFLAAFGFITSRSGAVLRSRRPPGRRPLGELIPAEE
jgi:hypothetical protein